MTVATGTKLGPYEILSPLGAGGMGEVYRARDTRLGREVAIKVLPEAFASDGERLARFDREARVLASLNHPAIAAIYGVEEARGTRILVLELVEGQTLAERIAPGPLPIADAMAFGRQIAEALEAAHEKGIVHRDLKPANVKVTPGGKVKVLDFGLAKAFAAESKPDDVSHSPTVTSGGTQHGVILGTAAYMSPEQARGKAVDKRTDVWAFGCLLYEMLSGHKAFGGETVSDTLASVLTREPDWNALPPDTPPRVRELLRRCLRKDPDKRLHDIADARIEIDDAIAAPSADTPAPPPRRSILPGALAAVAIVAAGLGALAAFLLARRTAPAGPPRLARVARVTQTAGRSEWPAWSPDGKMLAYSSNRNGNFEIYVRRGDGGQDINITNDPGQDIQPAFSPDGNTIAFISTRASRTGLVKIGGTLARTTRLFGGDLWVIPALGGGARRLAPDANFPTWRADGRAVFYVSGPENRRTIQEVPAAGGPSRTLLADTRYEITRLGCSPDGKWISFESQLEGVFLMPVSGGTPHRLFDMSFSHTWDGTSPRIYFAKRDPQGGTRILSVDVDLAMGTLRSEPRTLTIGTGNLWELAVARDGNRIAMREEEASRNLTRLPLTADGSAPAGPEEGLSTGHVTDAYPDSSPDARRIAFISDQLGHFEVWVLDLETGKRERMQLPGEDREQISGVWMPNGKELLLARIGMDGKASNWLVAVDGSKADQLFDRGTYEGSGWTVQPSPDGKRLLFPEPVNGVQQAVVYDFETRKRSPLTDSPGDKYDTVYSPDGRWIAVTALKDDTIQLFRMPAAGGPMQQLTTGYERMRHPFFSHDGKWIYIQPSHRNVYRVRAEGGPLEPVTRFPEAGLFLEEPTLSRDGRYLIYCRENGGSSIWLFTFEEDKLAQ